MRPRSTRFTGISGSNTVLSCSQTRSSSNGPSTIGAGAAAAGAPSASASRSAMRSRAPSSVVTVKWPPSVCAIVTRVPAGSTTLEPLGIRVASQSRASVMDPLLTGGSTTSTTGSLVAIARFSLRRHRRAGTVERGAQRVPGQRRALHARRELPHARKHGDLAQFLGVDLAPRSLADHGVDALEERLRFRLGLVLQRGSHQGRGGLGNGAAGALEADVLDHVARKLQVEGDLIAAQRIDSLGAPVGPLRLAEVARLLAVVDDDLLVEVPQLRAHPKTSRTLCRPAPSAPTSSRRVQRASQARARARPPRAPLR